MRTLIAARVTVDGRVHLLIEAIFPDATATLRTSYLYYIYVLKNGCIYITFSINFLPLSLSAAIIVDCTVAVLLYNRYV